MISGEICGVIFFLAKKPTFDQCLNYMSLFVCVLGLVKSMKNYQSAF